MSTILRRFDRVGRRRIQAAEDKDSRLDLVREWDKGRYKDVEETRGLDSAKPLGLEEKCA